MKEIPWSEKNLIFRSNQWPGIRVEEVTQPWDLYLEGYFLETTFGEADHVLAVQNGIERIFSIRDSKREPLANIITMPLDAKGGDPYWSKVRVLKTSNPMTINGKRLIVLDVIGKKQKRANRDYIKLTEDLFRRNGGILANECPNRFILQGKAFKKWKKSLNPQKSYNLCICSYGAYVTVTQLQAFTFPQAITLLHEGSFDEIYINISEPWMERLMDYLRLNPKDRPNKTWQFFGGTPSEQQKYVELVRTWRGMK